MEEKEEKEEEEEEEEEEESAGFSTQHPIFTIKHMYIILRQRWMEAEVR